MVHIVFLRKIYSNLVTVIDWLSMLRSWSKKEMKDSIQMRNEMIVHNLIIRFWNDHFQRMIHSRINVLVSFYAWHHKWLWIVVRFSMSSDLTNYIWLATLITDSISPKKWQWFVHVWMKCLTADGTWFAVRFFSFSEFLEKYLLAISMLITHIHTTEWCTKNLTKSESIHHKSLSLHWLFFLTKHCDLYSIKFWQSEIRWKCQCDSQQELAIILNVNGEIIGNRRMTTKIHFNRFFFTIFSKCLCSCQFLIFV